MNHSEYCAGNSDQAGSRNIIRVSVTVPVIVFATLTNVKGWCPNPDTDPNANSKRDPYPDPTSRTQRDKSRHRPIAGEYSQKESRANTVT